MIIKSAKGNCPFVQIHNSVFENPHISWRAKGLLGYLLSKPANWSVRSEDLLAHGTEGRDAVRTAMKELRQAGFAKLVNTTEGREWHVYETPQEPSPENPSLHASPENPSPEKANDWKSAPSNTKKIVSNNKESNKGTLDLVPESPRQEVIPQVLLANPEFLPAWKEFAAARKKKRRALTPRAANAILTRLAQRPEKAVAVLDAMLEFGWDSFEWDWDRLLTRIGGVASSGGKKSLGVSPAERFKYDR